MCCRSGNLPIPARPAASYGEKNVTFRNVVRFLLLAYLAVGLVMGCFMAIGAAFAGAPIEEIIVAVLLAIVLWPVCFFFLLGV